MQTLDSVSHVGDYLGRWKLSDPELVAETPTSWVYRVMRRKIGPLALKLRRPGADAAEDHGGVMQEWYAGQGAARVYALSDNAQLLEWLDGSPLSALVGQGKDDTATDIICQVITQLHIPRDLPPPAMLIPLSQRFNELLTTNMVKWPSAARDLLVRAQIIARKLLADMPPAKPLHGDLHHGNIMFSPRSWVAINANGILGDPAYEVASSFLHPMDMTDIVADPERITALADRFAARLGFERGRMLGFAVAHSALSACRELKAGRPVKHHLAVLPRLLSAYELASAQTTR